MTDLIRRFVRPLRELAARLDQLAEKVIPSRAPVLVPIPVKAPQKARAKR